MRPTKLNPERQVRIIEALRDGAYRKLAARAGGVSVATFTRWMAKGEARPRSRYAAFRAAVLAAEAEAELRYVVVVRRAADTDWKAAAWWLARKNPERWGYERRHRVAVQSGTGVIVVPGVQDIDAWQKAAVEQQRQLHDSVAALEREYSPVN